MLRRTLTLAAIAATLATAAATAQVRPGQAAAGEPLSAVKLLSCNRDAHDAAFHGRMRRVGGAIRMGMRFTLLERMPGGQFEPVAAEGLGRWRKSKPLKTVFAYRQRVRGLVESASYRSVVQFRWYDDEGKTLRQERRRSSICDQATPLPNLRARVIGAEPGNVAGVMRYSVRVVNRGQVPASDVAVRLAVDGREAEVKTIPTLVPGDPKVLALRGPRCHRSVEVASDPADRIAEVDEGDNGHVLPCADLAQ
jgi:hypothetical protein